MEFYKYQVVLFLGKAGERAQIETTLTFCQKSHTF